MGAWFVFFGAGFWVLCAIAMCAVVAFVEFENMTGAVSTAVVLGLALYFMGGHPGNAEAINAFLSSCWDNKLLTAMTLLAYFAIGVLWAMVRLRIYAGNKRDEYYEEKSKWSEESWKAKIARNDVPDFDSINSYGQMQSKIIMWMTWWIPSMIWTSINNPVKKIVKWLYHRFSGSYRWIYTSAMAKVIEEHQLAKHEVDTASGKQRN